MKCLFLFPAVVFATASCSKKAGTSAPVPLPENVVATVGDVQITIADFELFAAERNAQDTAEARAAVLEEMIAQEGLLLAAKAEGLDQTPEFRRAMRQFLITRLEERKLQPLLAKAEEISEEELEDACLREASRFARPAARRYSWLRVVAEGGETETTEKRIQTALSNFGNLPADPNRIGFGPVAAEFSDDGDTRYQGGDLGWLTPEQLSTRLPSEAVSQATNLKPGQTSDPIQLPDGFCIIQFTAERPATPISKHELRERIKHELITRRRAEARNRFLQSSRSALKVGINPEQMASTRIRSTPSAVAMPPDR